MAAGGTRTQAGVAVLFSKLVTVTKLVNTRDASSLQRTHPVAVGVPPVTGKVCAPPGAAAKLGVGGEDA